LPPVPFSLFSYCYPCICLLLSILPPFWFCFNFLCNLLCQPAMARSQVPHISVYVSLSHHLLMFDRFFPANVFIVSTLYPLGANSIVLCFSLIANLPWQSNVDAAPYISPSLAAYSPFPIWSYAGPSFPLLRSNFVTDSMNFLTHCADRSFWEFPPPWLPPRELSSLCLRAIFPSNLSSRSLPPVRVITFGLHIFPSLQSHTPLPPLPPLTVMI